MPDFTAPHSISYPIPGEFIKDGNFESKLTNDLKATALSVDLAITAEGERSTAKADAAQAAAAADATTKANTALTKSKAYTNQVVDTSHLARDADGTPYFSPGSMTLRVFTDTDGVPFFLDA